MILALIRGIIFLKGKFVTISAGALLLICMLALNGVNGTASIDHTDPEGDVSEGDIADQDAFDNIDITSLTMDIVSDPMIVELTVYGTTHIGGEPYDYSYYIYLDYDGDNEKDSTVSITGPGIYISGSGLSSTPTQLTGVTGEGTSTLRVELPHSLFEGTPVINDVGAESQVKRDTYRARDFLNTNFEGTGSVGGGEITPPDPMEDPRQTPTAPSLSIDIDDFDMDLTVDVASYDYVMEATGTGSVDIVEAYYCIAMYGESGEAMGSYSWQKAPIDEEHGYGGQAYKEEFYATGTGGSWTTWKWYFHSSGPIDDNNRNKFESPDDFYTGVGSVKLHIRAYQEDGTWNQDTEDITQEYLGKESTGDDDDTDDDEPLTGDGETDDTPGPALPAIVASTFLMAAILIHGRRRRS